ncbi:MAG: Efflux ABC transporter, permease protein, partial [uncultured Nocardioides sp.]
EPAHHARRRRPGADAGAPRPSHAGDAAGGAVRADQPAVVDVRGRPGRHVRPVRPRLAGDVPVHRDVPRHQRDHAAGTLLRHPRAPADHADGQARPAPGLRPRLRPAGGRAVGAGRGGQRGPPGPGRGGAGLAARAGRGGGRRAGHRARPARQRVRGHRVPGRAVHAAPRAAAGPAVRAVRPPRGAARRPGDGQRRAAAVVRRRRDAAPRRELGHRSGGPGRGRRAGVRRGCAGPGRRDAAAPYRL